MTVIREESITKASEVIHIIQPTLSRQLAQMKEAVAAGDLADLPLILPRRMQVQSELASWSGGHSHKKVCVMIGSRPS